MENQKLPKVCVIMSTYNGEKYLKEQIDSILKQKDIDLSLYISDDRSTDETTKIIEEYQKEHKNITLHINENNKNFTYNFLDSLFLFKDNTEFDYYAFADQDDSWLEDKLISAINLIKSKFNESESVLYSSNLKIVNEKLEWNGEYLNNYIPPKYQILGRNIVTGCTVVMNKSFKNLATEHYPENIYLHDYWLALIASFCKNAHYIYDENSYILYRQHGNNLIGSNKNKLKRILSFLFKKIPENERTHNLVLKFYELYKNEVLSDDLNLIEKLAYYKKFRNRNSLIWNSHGKISNRLKIKILLKKY